MKEFRRVQLREVVFIKGGKRLPLGEDFSTQETSHPYIRARDIGNGNIRVQDAVYLSDEMAQKLSQYRVSKGDVCITIVGANVGEMGAVPPELNGANLTENAVRIKSNGNIVQGFLKYALLAEDALAQMKVLAGGAAQPKLGIYKIETIEIPLPPLPTQRKIAAVLSAYDDLIENNLRRIKILEGMAQTLYREWFVKFRFPACAEASAGRPGHQKVKVVDSPLGKIPEGWEVSALGSLCTLIKEPYREALHASFPLIDLARIPQKTLLASEVGSSKELSTSRIIFSTDDVLFGAIRPYLHKVVLAPTNGVTNVSVFVLRSREEILKPFLAILLSMEDAVRWADQYSTGTKMPVIKWDVFQQMKVLIPKKEVIRGFYDGVWPMMQSVKNTFTRNSNLRQTRDLLLPKLISGELDVSELDITIPEANA